MRGVLCCTCLRAVVYLATFTNNFLKKTDSATHQCSTKRTLALRIVGSAAAELEREMAIFIEGFDNDQFFFAAKSFVILI